jgi:fumarylacetoacetate (FAA) hydrolase
VKLATLDDGTRDGALVVVSRHLARAVAVPEIARTLQHALDDWTRVAPALLAIADELDAGRLQDAHPFDRDPGARAAAARVPVGGRLGVRQPCRARAPRARRDDAARVLDRSADVPGRVGPHARPLRGRRARRRGWGIDFEGEVAVVTGDVAMGTSETDALKHVRLVMLVNDVSLRNLIPAELAKGFGFVQSKPASSFSPVAVTPDELGDAWRDGRLHRPLLSHVNDNCSGDPMPAST